MKINNKEYIYEFDKDDKKPPLKGPNNDLDKNAFLNLLTTQLANQDPLNPMEDREFIAQLAQFSSLEQMTAMNQTSEDMLDAIDFMNYNQMQANALILKEIRNISQALTGKESVDPEEGEVEEGTKPVEGEGEVEEGTKVN